MPAKGDRLHPVDRTVTRLQKRLAEAITGRSVQQVADEWDLPYWVIRDALRGAHDCPRAMYLPRMAKGLGITIEQLIEDAYSPLITEAVPA